MRVFVDSSVFIYGLEFAESNSALIYDGIARGTVKAVINEKVIKEVVNYFGRRKADILRISLSLNSEESVKLSSDRITQAKLGTGRE